MNSSGTSGLGVSRRLRFGLAHGAIVPKWMELSTESVVSCRTGHMQSRSCRRSPDRLAAIFIFSDTPKDE